MMDDQQYLEILSKSVALLLEQHVPGLQEPTYTGYDCRGYPTCRLVSQWFTLELKFTPDRLYADMVVQCRTHYRQKYLPPMNYDDPGLVDHLIELCLREINELSAPVTPSSPESISEPKQGSNQ